MSVMRICLNDEQRGGTPGASPSFDFFVFSSSICFSQQPARAPRFKRGQARVNRAAICVDLRRFAFLVVKTHLSYNHDEQIHT